MISKRLTGLLPAVFIFALLLFFAPHADAAARRIVSVTPVGTEILYALGQGSKVVGVTNFCDYPAEALKKPKLGSYSSINFEAIIAAKADLVVMSDLHTHFAPQLDKLKIKHVIIQQGGLKDIYASILAVGRACGADKRAKALTAEMKRQIADISLKVKKLSKPTVLLCVSRELSEPLITTFYAAGPSTFYNELINLAGGVNACSEWRIQYPRISLEGLAAMNPDVIIDLVGDKSFYHSAGNIDLNKIFNEKYLKAQWNRSVDVPATRAGRVRIMHGTLFLRPGPRMGVILKNFAKAIHPELSKK